MKKRYLFLILFVCLFAVSAVNGAEIGNDTNMLENSDDSGLMAESMDENVLSTYLNEEEIQGSADNGTFTDLQKKINDADEGAIIDLENNYTYDYSGGGIIINKTITINGNGHVIDALGQSGIFYITSPTVTLNNITFKNGYTTGDGGAIYFSDSVSNVSISGVFVNNSATYGGAIRFESGVSNSTISGVFVNNSAYCGGAIDFDVFLSNVSVSNVSVSGVFVNNSADAGGAIQFDGSVSNVSFSNVSVSGVFVNNSGYFGGAIGFDSGGSNVSVSGMFVNNSAYWGGAIYFHIYNGSCLNVSGEFVNNSADDGGAIYFLIDSCSSLNVSGEFVNNSARNNGGAIRFGCDVSNYTISGVFVNNSASYGGAISFMTVSNSTISGVFVNNSASYGGAIYFRDSVSGSTISGVFVNNSGGGAIDFYIWSTVSNSTIINSVVLNSISPRDFVFINNWFGNNAFNYESKPYSNCESWLFLDGAISPVSGVDGKYSVVFTLNNLYNSTSKSITHPDIPDWKNTVFELTATNGYLNKYTARPDESVIFTSTANKSGIVKASIDNFSFYLNIGSDNYVSAPNLTKYYGGSERFVVTVKDKYNKPVVGKDVNIYLNGVKYTRTTDSNGQASMAINLNSGVHKATSEFEGIQVESTITVKSTVSGNDITKIYKNGTQYYATFVDTNGNLLKNTDVTFNINGVYYTRTTNDKGVARMNINLLPKEYVLTAMNPVSGESCGNLITVLPNIVENYDLTKYYKNASKFTFRLLDNQGNPVGAGVSASLNINGVFYTRQTDENGYINMNINLNPGTYIATIMYNGLSLANTIKVLPILEAKDVVMKYRDGTKFEAKLLDGQGKPFANQTLIFNINGVMYNRITGDDGIARLNINLMPGEYIITSMYSNGATIANKVTIRS